jgi:ABC transport system ATP-binding/permease protein
MSPGAPPPAPLVTLEAATKAYGPRTLLDRVSLGVAAGGRVGVVGRNGAGKTTLLEALAGRGELDSGRATRARGLRLGYLPQAEDLALPGRATSPPPPAAEQAPRVLAGEVRPLVP